MATRGTEVHRCSRTFSRSGAISFDACNTGEGGSSGDAPKSARLR